MAIIKRGILGGFQKKIGNVVGSSWKGIDVMRSLPVSVANPRTAPQQSQRNKFSQTVAFAVAILAEVIKPLWDRFAQFQSGYNAFISANIDYFDSTGLITPASLEISRGKMASTPISTISVTGLGQPYSVNWVDDSGQGFKLASDTAFVVYWNETTNEVVGYDTGVLRSAGTFQTEALANSDTYHFWLAFRRADGTIVSNTAYRQA